MIYFTKANTDNFVRWKKILGNVTLADLQEDCEMTEFDYTAPIPTISDLSAVAASSSVINLSWTDESNGLAVYYNIYRGTTSGVLTLIGTTTNLTSYQDTGLYFVTDYYYKVSYVIAIESGVSNEATDTTLTLDIAEEGSAVSFASTDNRSGNLSQLTNSHSVSFWRNGGDGDFYGRVLSTSAGTITLVGSDTLLKNEASTISLSNMGQCAVAMDSTHLLIYWFNKLQVASVDTGTGVLTFIGSELTIASSGTGSSVLAVQKINANYAIVTYRRNTDNYTMGQIVNINTSTWAVTVVGSAYNLTASEGNYSCIQVVSDTRVIISNDQNGTSAQIGVFSINTTTGAIALVGSKLTIGSGSAAQDATFEILSSSRLYLVWGDGGSNIYNQVCSYDTTTGTITKIGSSVSVGAGRQFALCLPSINVGCSVVYASRSGGSAYVYLLKHSVSDVVTLIETLEHDVSTTALYSACKTYASNRIVATWDKGTVDKKGQSFIITEV